MGFGDPALQFSPDGSRIYMRLSVRGESHVASVALRGGQLEFHTRGPLDVRMGNLSADGRKMALTVGNATTPAEVAVLDCGQHRLPKVEVRTAGGTPAPQAGQAQDADEPQRSAAGGVATLRAGVALDRAEDGHGSRCGSCCRR